MPKKKPRNLSNENVHSLPAPVRGNILYGDKGFAGLALRVTANGDRTFVRNFRDGDGQRRETLGPLQNEEGTTPRSRKGKRPLSLTEARNMALLRGEEDKKRDKGESEEQRRRRQRKANLKTVSGLWEHFDDVWVEFKAERTQKEYRANWRNWVKPEIGHLNVPDVERADMRTLHAKITKTGARTHANRVLSLCSVMFELAAEDRIIDVNPCLGVKRNRETQKTVCLTEDHRDVLLTVLKDYRKPKTANLVKFLMWTGARKSEAMGARWDEFDLDAGEWTKPPARTKQRKEHKVSLLSAVVELLRDMKRETNSVFLFPSLGSKTGHVVTVWSDWDEIVAECRKEDSSFPKIGLHGLRHSFASFLYNADVPLGQIGDLLGHSNPQTTSRYAHGNTRAQSRLLEANVHVLTGRR